MVLMHRLDINLPNITFITDSKEMAYFISHLVSVYIFVVRICFFEILCDRCSVFRKEGVWIPHHDSEDQLPQQFCGLNLPGS